MNNIYLSLIFIFPLLAFNNDCRSDFDFKYSKKNSASGYSIELTLKSGVSEEYNFELYDLASGKVVSSNKVFFDHPNESKIIFQGVAPSLYTIYFSSDSCSKKKSIKSKGLVLE